MHNDQLLKQDKISKRMELRRKPLIIDKAYFVNQKAVVLLPSPISPYLGVISAPDEGWGKFISLAISDYHRILNAWKKQYASV